MLKGKWLASLLLLFSANAFALDLEPYVFTKTFVGYEQVRTYEPYSTASSLIEVGLNLPKNFSVSYSYFKTYPLEIDSVEIHSVGVAYKYYKVWK